MASLSVPEADSLGRFVGVQRVPWAVSVDDAPSLDELNGDSSLEGLNGDSWGAGASEAGQDRGEGDGALGGMDWAMLLLLLLLLLPEGAPEGGSGLNTDAPLPELGRGFELHSSPGCFFWTSAKHLEHRFMVLLDPQNPHGQRGGRLGGLLRSLVSPMTCYFFFCCRFRLGGGGGGSPSGKLEASSAALVLFQRQKRAGVRDKTATGLKVHKTLETGGEIERESATVEVKVEQKA